MTTSAARMYSSLTRMLATSAAQLIAEEVGFDAAQARIFVAELEQLASADPTAKRFIERRLPIIRQVLGIAP
jgi:hypothetical protein